jgi:hypothetical protein
MATKKITPTNPDTRVTDDEVEAEKDAAERKTASVKANRKTSSIHVNG